MNTDNKQLPTKCEDYESMLQYAVAVIEHARLEIAKHVNGNVSSTYWKIGKMFHERKIESGHGDGVVRQLSADLKERYPKMGLSLLTDYLAGVEVHTSNGRVDIVLLTRTDLYLIEIKMNKDAQTAIHQIDLNDYAKRFALCGKPVVKVGVNFDSDKGNIDDWTI